jgi:hypothetical protein
MVFTAMFIEPAIDFGVDVSTGERVNCDSETTVGT